MTSPTSTGPIASAYVEILPKVEPEKFEATILKAVNSINDNLVKALNRASTSAGNTSSKVKSAGQAGKAAGEEAASGFQKFTGRLHESTEALEKYERHASHAESTFRRIGTRIVEAFSIYSVAEFLKKSVEVTETFERTNRVVERAIETTGGVAGITIKKFDELGASMSLATGIGESAINSANQQLFAFTRIRDQVGAGNDIFTRAAKAIQDVSTRTGLGAVAVSRSLGKALEDPARASLVLRRASIILTAAQLKQIEAFRKSNNILGAQKVVLDALEQKFGGAAAAASDPLKRLGAAINQIERSLGEALLPTIDKLAESVIDHVPDIKKFVEEFGVKLHDGLERLYPVVVKVAHFIGDMVDKFKHDEALRKFAGGVIALVVAHKLVNEAIAVTTSVFKVMNGLFSASPIGRVASALTILTGVFIYAYTHSKDFRDVVKDVNDGFHRMFGYIEAHPNVARIIEGVAAATLSAAAALKIFNGIAATSAGSGALAKLFGTTAAGGAASGPAVLAASIVALGFTFRHQIANIEGNIAHFISGGLHNLSTALESVGGGHHNFLQSASDAVDRFAHKLFGFAGTLAKNPITIPVKLEIGGIIGPIAPGSPLDIQNRPHPIGPVAPSSPAGKSAAVAQAALDKANQAFQTWLAQQASGGAQPDTDPFGSDGSGKDKKKKGIANLTELMRQLVIRLNQGLTKGATAASQTISALEQKVKSALSNTLQAGLAAKTIAFIEKQRGALVGLAGQYFKVSQQTDVLKKKVDVLKKAADDFKKSVIDALQQTSNLDAFLGQTDGSTDASGRKIISSGGGVTISLVSSMISAASGQARSYAKFLFDQATQLKDFSANISTLISRIGDTAFVQDLASKGLASAGLVASLANASTGTLKQINELQSKILTLQHAVADAAGEKLQNAADKSNALLTKSVATQDKMLAKLNTLAREIATGIAAALGTKVPKFASGTDYAPRGWSWVGENGPELRYMRGGEKIISAGQSRAVVQTVRQGPTKIVNMENTFNVLPGGDPETHAQQLGARLAAWAER